MSIEVGRSTRNIPAACVPSKECVSVESGLGNSFAQRKFNIGKTDTLWTIMPSCEVSIGILYYINSWTTIVFSNVNISDIKMGLPIDSILGLMKCDKWLFLFPIRSSYPFDSWLCMVGDCVPQLPCQLLLVENWRVWIREKPKYFSLSFSALGHLTAAMHLLPPLIPLL